MYNEFLKNQYISERNYNSKQAERLFEATAKYEETTQTDLCALGKEEIQNVVDNVVGMRLRSIPVRLNILKDYAQWCIDHHIKGATDNVFKINQLGLGKIMQQTVGSPLHLERYLNCVFRPDSDETIDCVYKSYLWLAYSGMSEHDIMLVESNNVDFQNMIVRFGDDAYPIYKGAISPLKVCASSQTFAYIDDTRYKRYQRVNGDLLLRGYRSNPTYKTIRSELSRHAKSAVDSNKTKQSISYFRAWISGVFYRMYEGECAGIPVNFKYIADEYMRGKEYALKNDCDWTSKRNQVAKEFLDDYERWKTVHYANVI